MEPLNKSLLDRYAHLLLGVLLLVSFVIKYLYVFNYTDYTQFLFSDMGGYWERALESFAHGDHAEGQWAIWPPFPHMTLAWFFKLLYLFGLSDQRLELVLTANILLSVLSTLWIYLIALKLYPSQAYALLAGTVYAFFFPLVYLNAFVLSEHLSVFALLLSIVLILYARRSWIDYLAAGMVLAFAIGMRPSFGVLGLPAFLYILAADRTSRWRSLFYALVFTGGYAIFLLYIVVNNHANSEGKMSFLSAGGGISYYLSACEPYHLVTHYNGYKWTISAPAQSGKPELGVARETEPFYHQQFYYDLGKQCHEKSPLSWRDQLKRYHRFFKDSMFPYRYDARFAKYGIPIFSRIALGMTLLLLFLPLLFFNKKISRNTLTLITGIVLLQFAMHFFYTIEQRYLYGFFFGIVLLSVLVIFELFALARRLSFRQRAAIASAVLLAALIFWRAFTVSPEEQATFPVTLHLYQDSKPLEHINQTRHTVREFHTRVNTISFKNTYELIHDDLGSFGFEENFFIDFTTTFKVLKGGNYTFVVAFDDGFKLVIDQEELMGFSGSDDIEVRRKTLHLLPGNTFHYLLSYYQGDGDLGIRAYYEIDGKRFVIGEDSDYIHFSGTETNRTQ